MGGDRAEIYLRLLAEAQLRTAPGADGDDRVEQVRRAGGFLAAAGLITPESVSRIADELRVALTLRSPGHARRSLARLGWMLDQLRNGPPPVDRARPHARPMRITPIGRTLRIADERAPLDLHLMTLVCTPDHAMITVAMLMHWPSDGSSADLEITGAGPQHLPYQRLWALDDQGTRYLLSMSGYGETAAWGGVALLSPAPPPGARWLDLMADGPHPVIRLDLASRPGPAPAAQREPVSGPAGERLLARVADRIIAASWDIGGPAADRRIGEMTRVLTDAGALAADSQAPGYLAALCGALGAERHGIGAPPAAELPAPWASVVAQRQAPRPGPGPEVFAPLGMILPDIDGTRFALAGLSSAAGQSHLHVVASGLSTQEQADLPVEGWDTGFSWWLRDGGGRWHVGTAGDPDTIDGGEAAFRLRLTPPLTGATDPVEVTVAGSSARVRTVIPVCTAQEQ